MFKSRKSTVSISIAKQALESIFDECDKYEIDETGGRLLGTYRQNGAQYDIQVLGVLEPGPNASRSNTSFFQDGDYQEKIFRSLEETHPNIEHLGNWHTHHVNGYPTLSGGDKTTYFKTVNHEKHNTDFFYALLVLRRNPRGDPRYDVKHFLFRRNDDTIYEIPATQVRVVDLPVLWPPIAQKPATISQTSPESAPNLERVKDQEFFSEFYPNLKVLLSKNIGAIYWKGSIPLIDGSHAEVVALENPSDVPISYSISAGSANSIFTDVSASYQERRFPSARQAVHHMEKDLNTAIYSSKKA